MALKAHIFRLPAFNFWILVVRKNGRELVRFQYPSWWSAMKDVDWFIRNKVTEQDVLLFRGGSMWRMVDYR